VLASYNPHVSWPLVLALCAAAPQDARYEGRVVSWALDLYGRTPEPEPEGKQIEEILVASEDIIAPSDPWPQIANDIHVKTRELTVRRQLLFEVGQPYSGAIAAETERNMRTLFIFAVARVVPVKGRSPNGVGVLVVTKDLWSIRLDSAYNLIGTLLQYLRIRPTEENFLGMDKTLQLDFFLKLDTLAIGELFYDPRLFGSRWEALQQLDVLFNRHTKQAEGSAGQVVVDRPLFSLETEWGFSVGGSWDVEVTRIFQGAEILGLPYPSASAPTDSVPFVYDTRVLSGAATATRSFGRYWKTNLSVGYGGYSQRYTPPVDSTLTGDEKTWLSANYLPWNEDATYLVASVGSYQARYGVLRDLDTFALSEDVQLGHSVAATVRWSEPAWGSPARFVEGGLAARYRAAWADDLLVLSAAGTARYMPGVSAAGIVGPWVNERFAVELKNYSPSLGFGRLVTRVLYDERRNDLNRGFDFLGGDLGLRGVSADALLGTRELLWNVEYRTRPLEFHTVHAGLVFFYDAGSAFDVTPALVHTFGVGIRALFPQLDVQPVRIDLGFAINGPYTPFVDRFSSSFGQVTDFRLPKPNGVSFLDQPLN
jgi:hypothetical protein